MRLIAVLALFALGTILSFIKPIWSACFLIFINIFRPFDFAYAQGMFGVGEKIIIIFALSYIFGIIRGGFKPKITFITISIVLFISWTWICSLMSFNSYYAQNGFILVVKYLSPIIFVSTMFNTKRDLEYFLGAMALAVGLWGAQAGIHGLILGGRSVITMGIPGAQMGERNDFITGVLIAIPLLVYLWKNYDGYFKQFRHLILLLILFCIIAVPLSHSRGGMIGLICTVFFIAMISRKRIKYLIYFFISIPVIYFITPQHVFDRMHTVEIGKYQQESSAQNRLALMLGGIEMASDYPIFGVGSYCFIENIEDYVDDRFEPHSIWIKCAAELGIPGLVLYLGILLVTIVRHIIIYFRYFEVNSKIAHLSIALCSAHIGFNSSATFSSQLYFEYHWLLLALSGGFQYLVFREEFTDINNSTVKSFSSLA